jgi:hypothetical protein
MNNISIYHKEHIEVPNSKNVYFQEIKDIDDDSIDNIYLHDTQHKTLKIY